MTLPTYNRTTQQQSQQQYSPETIKLATYNIRDARNTRLQQVCYDLEVQNIGIAILTEMRIPETAPIHTQYSSGYTIFSTYTKVKNQGGIAIAYRQAKNWHIESEKMPRPRSSQLPPCLGNKTDPPHRRLPATRRDSGPRRHFRDPHAIPKHGTNSARRPQCRSIGHNTTAMPGDDELNGITWAYQYSITIPTKKETQKQGNMVPS